MAAIEHMYGSRLSRNARLTRVKTDRRDPKDGTFIREYGHLCSTRQSELTGG
jgi:hypothetical protein